MSNTLNQEFIFSPGAVVEVQTCRAETIIGEVLAFEYDARLLILKSQASNNASKTSNVTCVNLDLCSRVQILAEPDQERTAAEAASANTKLPDIDLKKLEERLRNAVEERRSMQDAYKSGAGIDGIALYSRLTKTVGEAFGVSWERNNITIGKNIIIEKPYGANNISIRNSTPHIKMQANLDTSLNYAKQLVEKFWRDQNKDPYAVESHNSISAASPPAPQTNQHSHHPPNSASHNSGPQHNTSGGKGSNTSGGQNNSSNNRKSVPA